MNAATICVYGILAILLTMFIVYLFPTNCEVSRTEGFQVDDSQIQVTCPAGAKPYLNATGQTLCCRGTINGRVCEGKVVCSFSEVPGSMRIPICKKRRRKYTGPIDSWIKQILSVDGISRLFSAIQLLEQAMPNVMSMPSNEVTDTNKANYKSLVLEEKSWVVDFKNDYADELYNPGNEEIQQIIEEEGMYIFTKLQDIFKQSPIARDQVKLQAKFQQQACGAQSGSVPAYQNPQWKQMPGGLKQVEQDGSVVCGVNSSDQIYCADQNIYSNPNWFQLPGSLKHISVSGQRVCGTNANNDIYCADNYRSPQWKQIPGKLKQIDLEGSAACGVNMNDDIYCADNVMNPSWRYIPGKLKHITLSKGRVYGVNEVDNIYYGGSKDAVNWRQIPGGLKQVDMDGNIVCGVNKYDNIYCKEDLESGNWKQLPGSLKYISVNQGKLYGVNASDNIFSAS